MGFDPGPAATCPRPAIRMLVASYYMPYLMGPLSSCQNIERECWKPNPIFGGDIHPDRVTSTATIRLRDTEPVRSRCNERCYFQNRIHFKSAWRQSETKVRLAISNMVERRIDSTSHNVITCPVVRSRSNYSFSSVDVPQNLLVHIVGIFLALFLSDAASLHVFFTGAPERWLEPSQYFSYTP